MIDEKILIEMIKDYKKKVYCDGGFANTVYGMAHDHIIEIIEILARHTQKGTDNEQREAD